MAGGRTSDDLDHKFISANVKEHQATVEHASLNDEPTHLGAEDAKYNRRVNRKMDIYLLPMVCFIYLLGYLDRANVGNARVVRILPTDPHQSLMVAQAGFTKDIKLTDWEYKVGKWGKNPRAL